MEIDLSCQQTMEAAKIVCEECQSKLAVEPKFQRMLFEKGHTIDQFFHFQTLFFSKQNDVGEAEKVSKCPVVQ